MRQGLEVVGVDPRALSDEDRRAWEALRGERAPYDTAFFEPAFLEALAAVRDDVAVVRLADEHGIVGFFPHHRLRGFYGRRGGPLGLRLGDFHGPLARERADLDALTWLRAADLLRFRFNHLPADQTGFEAHVHARATSPYVDLSRGFEAWVEERQQAGSSWVKQTQRKARRLEREVGAIEFSWHANDRAAFAELLAWKAEQRRRTHTTDPLEAGWALALVERLRALDEPGLSAPLATLRAGGKLLAVHQGLASKRALHLWFPTYDPHSGRHSPGSILLLELARAAAERGLVRFDLGRGAERYKSSLESSSLPLVEGAAATTPFWSGIESVRAVLVQGVRARPALKRPVRWARRLLRR